MEMRTYSLFYALILSLWLSVSLAHDSDDPREFIIMKESFRQLIAYPLPTTPVGNVDAEKIIVEASMATLPNLTPEMDWNISMVILSLQANDMLSAEQYWIEFIKSIKNTDTPIDYNATVLSIFKEVYLEVQKKMLAIASKVKHINDKKKMLRNDLSMLRSLLVSAQSDCLNDPELCRDITSFISKLDNQLLIVEEDSALANLELQNVLQTEQQLLITVGRVAKLLHDIAMNIVRNTK